MDRRCSVLALAGLLASALAACDGEKPPVPEGEPRFVTSSLTVSLPVGYAEEVLLALEGGAAPTWLVARPDGEVEDVYHGFVGAGSDQEPILLQAGRTLKIRLSVTSVDARKPTYQLPVALFKLSSKEADPETAQKVSSAVVDLSLRFPAVNLELKKVSEEEVTLAQTWRITNRGDTVEDLKVVAPGLLGSLVRFEPTPEHMSLEKDAFLELTLIPQLYPGMKSLSGELEVQAGEKIQKLPITFTVPADKGVFIGLGASRGRQVGGGSFCTSAGKIQQWVGKPPRQVAGGSSPDLFSKGAMADAYGKGTGERLAAGQALRTASKASWLSVPFLALEWVFKGIADAISKDPPDPAFKVIALPTLRVPPIYPPDPASELSQQGADALNALVGNGVLIADIAGAAVASLDKLGGARQASDTAWARKQQIVYRAYTSMLADRVRVQADLLRAFLAVAPAWFGAVSAEQVQQMQSQLQQNGFAAEELSAFGGLGLTAADLAAMKAAILGADPARVAQHRWEAAADRLWATEGSPPADLGRLFELAAGSASELAVQRAGVSVRFELETGRCPIAPHTTRITFNGQVIGSLENLVPEGIYYYPVPPASLRFFGALPGGNLIGVETGGINTGDFVRARDLTLHADHSVHGELVVADDQADADLLVAELPTMNRKSPDLLIAANQLPPLRRASLQPTEAVALPLLLVNLGAVESGPVALAAFAADPRDGSPGPALAGPVTLPSIPAGGQAQGTLTLTGAQLKGTDGEGTVYLSAQLAVSSADFELADNVMALQPESVCSAE